MRTLILPFLLLPFIGSAQPFNWQWSVHDTASLATPDVAGFATDAMGNSYITGQFFGSVSFGPLPEITSVGLSDIYVAKFDNQGNALWAVRAGGTDFDTPFALALDTADNVYITGSFESPTIDFGGTAHTLVGNMDIFVARLQGDDGSFVWSQRFGSNDFTSGAVEWGRAIACDANGDVYLTGCFRYTLDVAGLPTLQSCSQYYNGFVLKLDPAGNGLWSRRTDCGHQWTLSASEGQAITIGDDNMLYVGLRARGDTVFFETDTLVNVQTSGQAHDGVVGKYDLAGNYVWSRIIGGYGYDDVQALRTDALGNVYVAMHREGSYGQLGLPGIDISGTLGIYRNVVLKYDALGQLYRGTRMGNSTYNHDIEAMQLDSAGNVLVGGWHQGNFEIGGIVPNPGTTGSYGLFLARFDSSLVLTDLHASRHTYPRGIRGIGTDVGNNVYVGGYFQDSLSLTGLPVMTLGNSGGGAMFVARSGDFPTAVAPTFTVNAEALVFPVPSSGPVALRSDRSFNRIVVRNALGRVVEERTTQPTRQHDLHMNTPGLYSFELWRGEERVATGRGLIAR